MSVSRVAFDLNVGANNSSSSSTVNDSAFIEESTITCTVGSLEQGKTRVQNLDPAMRAVLHSAQVDAGGTKRFESHMAGATTDQVTMIPWSWV